jgi:hypothetical protein
VPKALVCDFCGATVEFSPSWRFPARDFTVMAVAFDAKGDKVMEEPWESKGDWSACDTCHGLVEEGEREKLRERSVRSSMTSFANASDAKRKKARKMIREGTEQIHDAFFEAREGEARRDEGAPQRQRMLATEALLHAFGEKLRVATSRKLVARAFLDFDVITVRR